MKSIEENKYYIWLSSIENLSAIQKINLLNKFINPQNIFQDYYKNKETVLLILNDPFFSAVRIVRKGKEYKNVRTSAKKTVQ